MQILNSAVLVFVLAGSAAAQDAPTPTPTSGHNSADRAQICMNHVVAAPSGRVPPDPVTGLPASSKYEPAFADICAKLDRDRAAKFDADKAAKAAADLDALKNPSAD